MQARPDAGQRPTLSPVVRLGVVERERRQQVAVGIELRLELGDLLLGDGDGIGPGNEAAWRRLLADDRQQRPGKLARVAGLLAMLSLIPCPSGSVALGVVRTAAADLARALATIEEKTTLADRLTALEEAAVGIGQSA